MKRYMYDFTSYTHAENNEMWSQSGVSNRKTPEKLTMAELIQLADAYEVTVRDMADWAHEAILEYDRNGD